MKMNKTRLLEKISIQSGISADECSAVLKIFERVLSEELTRKIHRYGGWILLLVALLVSAVAFSQTPQRKGRPVQTIRGMVIDGGFKTPDTVCNGEIIRKRGNWYDNRQSRSFQHTTGSCWTAYGRGGLYGI